MSKLRPVETYRGYSIEYDYYDRKEYTVFFNGDDYWFEDKFDAYAFIDDMLAEEEEIAA
jgi:hypothetical protein